ncbi:MAG: FtsX-like permease family protein, partial [Phyllobacteriaceae bacterium]|nr:FtsX-like permease family protein [Phyllobacteriaceae bacterium]
MTPNPMLWLRYALKNLRSGLKGFWIFLTCLTLGVAAIAIVGSLSAAIERGLAEQGQPLLGGDLEFSLIHREVNDKELAFIRAQGEVSRIATLRAMATANGRSTLVEIKSVDAAYPLYGAMAYEPGASTSVLAAQDSTFGIAVDPLLLGRLGVTPGSQIKIGSRPFTIAAVIAAEPDRISDGIVLGPRLLMSHAALESTGLIQPGSLITWRYRVKLSGDTSLSAAKSIIEKANAAFPDSGWRIRARDNAAQGAERFVERLGYFMSLVGIAALVIGGAGIANAVSAFVTRRTGTIATLKCLGLSNRDVMGLFLTEIMLVSMLGIAVALGFGAVAPAFARFFFGNVLPLPLSTAIETGALGFAGALGLLTTLAFAILPLARISRIPGAALFRSHLLEGQMSRPWRAYGFAALMLALATGLVLVSFDN